MKIAIVGPEESKWTEEQRAKVKRKIGDIFEEHGRHFDADNEMWIYDSTLVSGHCHKGGVDVWAEDIADVMSIKKEIYPAEINQWPDGSMCICCGEILSYTDEESITMHTKSRDGDWNNTKRLKGYRSRNIQIAKACDVLYCLVPHVVKDAPFDEKLSPYCKHCETIGHPSNGGCWTMKHAKKLGKETHLVVIS